MPKLSLCITTNNIPIDTLFEIFLTLTISTHHINIESEHCDMNSSRHLINRCKERIHEFLFISPCEGIVLFRHFSDRLYDDSDSTFIEEVEVMRYLRSFAHNFLKLSKLFSPKEEFTHFFHLKSSFSPLTGKNFFDSCHDVILIWI